MGERSSFLGGGDVLVWWCVGVVVVWCGGVYMWCWFGGVLV